MYIKNALGLVENGRTGAEREARRLSLDALESGLQAVEPSMLVLTKVALRGDILSAGGVKVDLGRYGRIFVIGGGKASAAMARAVEGLLGDRITDGVVNVPESQSGAGGCRAIRFNAATHPLPSEKGERGVEEMLEMVGEPDEDTLVICLISGGGSALLPMPREGIALSDKVEVTRSLLKGGASIGELNIVRKHLSAIKGGWLAKRLYPSRVLSLVISDVIGNRLDSIASGPLFPDPSTFGDAVRVLKKYRLWEGVSPTVSNLMRNGVKGVVEDTPKPGSKYFRRVSNVIIGSNRDACSAAVKRLRGQHCRPTLLTTSYQGEASETGGSFGSLVRDHLDETRPRSWIAGGETTVTVSGSGRGGRNQEFALGSALKIRGNPGVAILSMGTDGIDGPTDAAGAMVDGSTVQRAKALGFSPMDILHQNDSYRLFRELGDLLMTGPTGTNVNDICAIVLGRL